MNEEKHTQNQRRRMQLPMTWCTVIHRQSSLQLALHADSSHTGMDLHLRDAFLAGERMLAIMTRHRLRTTAVRPPAETSGVATDCTFVLGN